jgi:pimeloyl-ACP methyl ester carboxylesterase
VRYSPQIGTVDLYYKGKKFSVEYFYRNGETKTILFVHGLGGAKENFWEACKVDALGEHSLFCFDNPGTGNSTYFDDLPLNVDDLAAITNLFVQKLHLDDFILCGTSMGGLTTLLFLRGKGRSRVSAYINIEGNLMPEDCMFSSKVVSFDFNSFSQEVFPKTIIEMKAKGNSGYHIIANNLQLNTHVFAYYNYSFQTVTYSATGELLKQYLSLTIPRIFIYGSNNKGLSYIPELLKHNMNVAEIPDSDHFVFYDNPMEMYEVIAEFITTLK